jgi:hypothetical protein
LPQFKYLLTIDMRLHFMELAAESRRKRGEDMVHLENFPGDGVFGRVSELHGAQAPRRDFVGAVTEARDRERSESLGRIEIDADEEMHGVPANPLEAQAVAEGVFKQNTLGDSLLDLEQHRGVYARMGSLAPAPKREVRSAKTDMSRSQYIDNCKLKTS